MVSGVRVAKSFSPERFGRLVTTGPWFLLRRYKSGSRPSKAERFQVCQCDCGNFTVLRRGALQTGNTQSCGCLFRDEVVAKLRSKQKPKPGLSKSLTYNSYKCILRRVLRTEAADFANYGGRGIGICDRWNPYTQPQYQGFLNFLADMGHRPSAEHSIDRIDPNGDYCPENCRWATTTQQARNRRNVKRYEHDGNWYTIPEIAELLGLHPGSVRSRLDKHGMEGLFAPRQREARRKPKPKT